MYSNNHATSNSSSPMLTPVKNVDQMYGTSSSGGANTGGALGGGYVTTSGNTTQDVLNQLGGGSSSPSSRPASGSGVNIHTSIFVKNTPTKATQPAEGVALQGYGSNSPSAIARGGRLPSGSSSSPYHGDQRGVRPLDSDTLAQPAEEGGLEVDQAELQSKMAQLAIQGEIALGATDAQVSVAAGGTAPNTNNNKRGVAPLGGKKTSDAQLSSARAMARKLSAGSNATTDAARLVALEEEVRALTMQVHNQEKGLVSINAELEKAKKSNASLSVKLDKEQAANKDLTNKLKVAESQLALTKREMAMLQKQAVKSSSASSGVGSVSTTGAAKAAAQELHQKDMQLRKALEDLEKCQAQLREKENLGSGALFSEQKQQLQHLMTENKKMDAQRMELLACVKKQAKLIDVLKRQKMHLEAAKLLQISENEFTKALECNLEP